MEKQNNPARHFVRAAEGLQRLRTFHSVRGGQGTARPTFSVKSFL